MGLVTLDELEQRVVKATVDLYRDRAEGLPGETALDVIVRLSGVPVGHVRGVLDAFRVKGTFGRQLAMTEPILEAMEAHVLMPIAQEASAPRQQFNVTAGEGSQVQVGHHVSGSQSMVTYQQVLDALEQEIERSPMPAEQKQSAIEKLGKFIASPGVVELLAMASSVLTRG